MQGQIQPLLACQSLAELILHINLDLVHTLKFLLTDRRDLVIQKTGFFVRQLAVADQPLHKQLHMSHIPGIRGAVFIVGDAEAVFYNIQNIIDRARDQQILTVIRMIILGIDKVEGDIPRLIQGHLLPSCALIRETAYSPT